MGEVCISAEQAKWVLINLVLIFSSGCLFCYMLGQYIADRDVKKFWDDDDDN